jgi:hypothetical protein
LLLSWLQFLNLVPVVEEKGELVGNILFHSLCVSLIVSVLVMQLAGASKTYGPCRNIQCVYEIKTENTDLPTYFCNYFFV